MQYVQYYLDTGLVKASNSVRVPEVHLPEGIGQIECDDDVDPTRVRVKLETGALEPYEAPPEE